MNQQFITLEILEEFGINLDGKDVDALLTHLNDTLAERIGAEITDSLDDDKLTELLDLQKSASEETVSKWLEENVPELEEIVEDEKDILLGELAENADELSGNA